MVGLIQEGDDLMGEDYEDGVKDAALISAAQRVEHYEMAAYGCVKTWAGLLGDSEAKALLAQTLASDEGSYITGSNYSSMWRRPSLRY